LDWRVQVDRFRYLFHGNTISTLYCSTASIFYHIWIICMNKKKMETTCEACFSFSFFLSGNSSVKWFLRWHYPTASMEIGFQCRILLGKEGILVRLVFKHALYYDSFVVFHHRNFIFLFSFYFFLF